MTPRLVLMQKHGRRLFQHPPAIIPIPFQADVNFFLKHLLARLGMIDLEKQFVFALARGPVVQLIKLAG